MDYNVGMHTHTHKCPMPSDGASRALSSIHTRVISNENRVSTLTRNKKTTGVSAFSSTGFPCSSQLWQYHHHQHEQQQRQQQLLQHQLLHQEQVPSARPRLQHDAIFVVLVEWGEGSGICMPAHVGWRSGWREVAPRMWFVDKNQVNSSAPGGRRSPHRRGTSDRSRSTSRPLVYHSLPCAATCHRHRCRSFAWNECGPLGWGGVGPHCGSIHIPAIRLLWAICMHADQVQGSRANSVASQKRLNRCPPPFVEGVFLCRSPSRRCAPSTTSWPRGRRR